jgi:hypothetical protein
MRLGEKTNIALALALAAAPVAAANEDQSAPPPDMQKLLQDCDAHKFETTIHVIGDDGQPHDSDLKACGKQGQSDADWVRTLKDIVDKAAANQEMPQPVKDQVITAVNAEIARLTALLPKEVPVVANLPPPRVAPKDDLGSDYSSLPPMPPPVTAPQVVVAQPQPGTVTSAPIAVAATSVPAVPVAPAPRLTLRCMTGRDVSLAEPCYTIERGNLLVVQSEDASNSGVKLKFLRRGEPRGELSLPPMRGGQPVTVALPNGICAGVAHTRIEIIASRAGSSEVPFGPYDLRC